MKTPYLDVNAWLGAWPFQYFHDDTAAQLERRLEAEGIASALVGSPEAAFNPDCLEANRRLVKRLAGRARLRPVPALDPSKGDWQDSLRLARDEGAAAVRLFPTFHLYELEGAEALAAIERVAADGGIALFLQMRMEDERTHHLRCKVPGLGVAPILAVAAHFPSLPVVALCPYYHEAVELAKGPGNIRFDLSHVETLRTVASLAAEVPVERVLFGTHAPFLQPRAAVMKLEAPYVPVGVRAAIGAGNARAILPAGRTQARGRPSRI
jgi:predicted TIM-barrel fold metal-dependent hydrolase